MTALSHRQEYPWTVLVVGRAATVLKPEEVIADYINKRVADAVAGEMANAEMPVDEAEGNGVDPTLLNLKKVGPAFPQNGSCLDRVGLK